MPGWRTIAPIDPGYGRLGAALGGGLESGAANFLGGRDRKRQQEEREEETAIQRALLGIREGPAPSEGYTTEAMPNGMRGTATPRDTGRYERISDALFVDHTATPSGRAAASQRELIEHRTRLAAEQAEQGRRLREEEIAGNRGRILAALQNPEDPAARADLIARGVDLDDVTPQPRAPVRGTPEWYTMIETEEGIRDRYRDSGRGGGGRGGGGDEEEPRLTYSQALTYVQRRFSRENPQTGAAEPMLTPEEEMEYARSIAAGKGIPRAPAPEFREDDLPLTRPSRGGRLEGALDPGGDVQLTPEGPRPAPGPDGAGGAPRQQAAPSDSLRSLIEAGQLTDEELKEFGFSQKEINAARGGGARRNAR